MPPDALIVGAGPAGAATAILLTHQGLRVQILEKSSPLPPKVCGEYLSPGCLPILHRLGALEPLISAGARPLFGMRIHSRRGRVLDARYAPGQKSVHGFSVRRTVLDPLLLNLACAAGATLETGFQASDLLWHNGRVIGVRGRARGHWAERRADLVIGADGRASVVAARLGGRWPHPWLDRMACVGYLEDLPREDACGEIFLAADRYAILNPIAPGLTNVGIVMPRKDTDVSGDGATAFTRMAAGIPGLGARIGPKTRACQVRRLGPLAFRAARLSAPGVILVGDAAAFLDPFTGEGIYAALRCAELAAQALACRADCAAYAAAWHREFDPKWRLMAALQHALRRPWLAESLVAVLARRPAATTLLMAAAGDLVPAAELRAVRLMLQCVRESFSTPAASL